MEPLQSLHTPLPTNYIKKSTPAGWNDPPMLSTSAPIQVITTNIKNKEKNCFVG